MPWYVYSLLASALFAIVPLQKRRCKDSPKDVMFWSSVFATCLTLVLFPFLEFPDLNLFYLGAIFAGLTGVFGGVLQFKLSERNMGRTLPVQLPVQILACFIFYCLLHPAYYSTISGYGIYIACSSIFVLMILSQFLRKSDNTIVGLITVTPVSLLFAVIIVYYKLIMEMIPGNPSNVILAYILVHYFTVAMCFLIENILNKESTIAISESLTSSSLLIAVLYVFGYYFLFSAVYYASNPAFAITFNLLIPVWIKLYSVVVKKYDDASLKVALIMLLAFSILIIAA
ncbi:MAG TPA: hypothetical protein DCL21_05300 [Alphaproteobacteria bacterium]|nr:hypothetical protein [Alphaproteobacteria bacterium]